MGMEWQNYLELLTESELYGFELDCHLDMSEQNTDWSYSWMNVIWMIHLLVAILEARRKGMKFFCSINMPVVVMRTFHHSSKIAACWWEEPS